MARSLAITLAGLSGIVLLGAAATAPLADAPPPDPVTLATIDAWVAASGIDTRDMHRIGATSEGVYYNEKMLGGLVDTRLSKVKSRSLDIHFERFKPRKLADGHEVRSEKAQLIFACKFGEKIQISRTKAFEKHGLKGASNNQSDPAVWTVLTTEFATPDGAAIAQAVLALQNDACSFHPPCIENDRPVR